MQIFIGTRHLYQIPGMKDVAMDIHEMIAINELQVQLSVEWWNVGPHKPFNMNTRQVFTMPTHWISCLEEYVYQGELFVIEEL